jgi:hypothetical protein
MKLSNKILLGFFGFIFLYLTAAFAELRLSGTPNVIDDKNSMAETVDIRGITYLVLNDFDKNVKVIGSDHSRLEVRSFSGDLLKKLKYELSGDTLKLSGLALEDSKNFRVSIFVSETGLKGITVKSSHAIIENLQQPLLHLSQNSGRVWMSDNRIAKIQMDLSNRSFLDINTTNVDTLSAKIDGSQVLISSPVGLVQGSMENKSFLRLGEIREIQLKKDKSSDLNMNQ